MASSGGGAVSAVREAGVRGRRGARVGEVTARGYPSAPARGIAVRPWRLRHPADVAVVPRQAGGPTTDLVDSRLLAHREPRHRGPTMRPDAGDSSGPNTNQLQR